MDINSNKIIVRVFKPEDQNVARKIVLAGLGERFGFIDEAINPDLDDIMQNYIAKGNIFVVAENKRTKEIVGTGAIVFDKSEKIGDIVRVSVKVNFRGLGIGKQITRLLIESARKLNYKKVVVATEHNWASAIGLYKSLGFKEYAKDKIDTHLFLDLSK